MNASNKESSSKLSSAFKGTGGINERLLQYIWQFQYFNTKGLVTSANEAIEVVAAGQINSNQGPDFLNAKIRIGKTLWAGTVEMHINTSDWNKHKHQADKNYDNVILHVVWQNDKPESNRGENDVPVLELKERVSKILLQRYEDLMNAKSFIPCEKSIHSVKDITWKAWKERLLAGRLIRKALLAEDFLKQNNYHWEETFWWMLARNFGMKVNADAFESIAKSIPLNVLAKHKNQIHQLEALLIGQAGLLTGKFKDDYINLLQKEYNFLEKKYSLNKIHQPVHFLRMRPGNFPTIRLAQLAMLVKNSSHLFSKIKEAKSVSEIRNWFDVTANDYWHYHYRFDETSSFKKKNIGTAMIDNIIINTIVPLLFAYGNYHDENKYKDNALKWLESTAAESNSITKGFIKLEIENKNAFDSQALIEMKNEYCNKKRCLDCAVWNAILRNN